MAYDKTGGEDSHAIGPALNLDRFPLGLETSLDQHELAELLHLRYRTLETWRRAGTGPKYWRCAGRPYYRIRDVLSWEASLIRNSTLEEHELGR